MNRMKEELIAPCGMNCRICLGYQREKNQCKGCRSETKGRVRCIIKNCSIIQSNESGFCFECDKFPCRRVKQLDERYRTKHHMSMLENLEHIKRYGIDSFLRNEETKWTCKECGNIVCVHRVFCLVCKTPYME